MTSTQLMLLLSIIRAQCLSRLPSCPASCVVCSEEAVICHRLASIIDAPGSTQALLLTEGSIWSVDASSLSDLQNVSLLGLSHNRISALGDHSFRNLSVLHTLLLDHNLLTSQALQGGALTNLALLEVLSLSNNQLTMIKGSWLEGTRALRTLQLGGNLLTRLDLDSFPQNDLSSLETLDLSDNLLENLDTDCLRGLVGLQSLDLSRNRLSSAPAEAFSYLSWLTSLNLQLNTWNCSCQLLGLADFLSNYIQQPDKVLYNGRRMVCVSAENPAVTTVLELTEANCVPANQNITLQIEAGHSVTPQRYARDLAITAVVCFIGGVGLTLLVVLIYHQVTRRKEKKDKNKEKEKEEGGVTVANHTVNHQDGGEEWKDLHQGLDNKMMLANNSHPWNREDNILDPRMEINSSHFKSMLGENGSHFRCPDCIERHRGAELHDPRRDSRMDGGMVVEEERDKSRRRVEEERKKRQQNQQGVFNRDSIATSNKPPTVGSPSYYSPTHRQTANQNGLRPDILSSYQTGRELDNYRTGMNGKDRLASQMLSCESCHKTYENKLPGQTDRQEFKQTDSQERYKDSGLYQGYSSQHRANSLNYNRLDSERNGGVRREMRNVTFALQSSRTLDEAGNAVREDRKDRMRTSREKESGRGRDRERKQKARVQSSRLLKVKLNLNPLRRNQVHPKPADTERRSTKRGKPLKGKEGTRNRGSSSLKHKQSRERNKSKSTEEEEEEEEEEGRERGQKSKSSSKQKRTTSKTQPGQQEGSRSQHTPDQATNDTASVTHTTNQSGLSSAAGGSAIGQQVGAPTNGLGQNVQVPNFPYLHGNGLAPHTAQLTSQIPFSILGNDRNRTANLSLLGASSSQLTGSSLSLQGGSLLGSIAPNVGNTMTPNITHSIFHNNTANTMVPNMMYSGLATLAPNTASSGHLENLSLSRQAGLGLNPASLLGNTTHTSPMPISSTQPSSMPGSFTQPSPMAGSTTQPSPMPISSTQPSFMPGSFTQPSPMAGSFTQPSPMAGSTTQPSHMAGSTTQPSPMPISSTQPSSMPGSFTQPSPMAGGTIQPSPMAGSSTQPSPMAGSTTQPSPMAGSTTQPSPMAGSTTQPSPMAGSSTQPSSMAGSSTQPSPMADSSTQPSSMPGNSTQPSPMYSTQHGGLAVNSAINATAVQSLSQTQPSPDTTNQGPRLNSGPTQGPSLQSREGQQQLAPQPPAVLQGGDSPSVAPQALGPLGREGLSPQAPGSVIEENLSNNNSLTQTGSAGGVSTLGCVSTSGGVSTGGGCAASISASGGVSKSEGVSTPGGKSTPGGMSAAAGVLQQEYLSEEGGSPKRKLRLVLPEKASSRPPTALERKVR